MRREVPLRVGSERRAVAWCLEVHDLVLSKCAAGRDRDWEYARETLRARIVEAAVLLERLPDLPPAPFALEHVERMLRPLVAAGERGR